MNIRVVDHYRPGPRRLSILLSCRCVVNLTGGKVPQTFECPEGHQPKPGRPRKSRVPPSRPRVQRGPVTVKYEDVVRMVTALRKGTTARVYTDEELLGFMGGESAPAALKAGGLLAARLRSRR